MHTRHINQSSNHSALVAELITVQG